ncbi:MAG: hypothetical protein WCT32_02665 [Patescibacteria group bacterium]|jgi:hypothetical protein
MDKARVPSLLCGKIPERYRLSAAGGDPNLRIWIKRDVWENLLRLDWQEAARQKGFSGLPPFADHKEGTAFFGFGRAASYMFVGFVEDSSSDVVLDFDLQTAEYDPVSGWRRPNHDSILCISATLNLLFAALGYDRGQSGAGSQLLTIDHFITTFGMRGGSFCATLSADLMNWLSQKGQCYSWPDLEAPVKLAYKAMAGDESDVSWLETIINLPTGLRFKVPPSGGMLWMAHPWEPGHGAELQPVDVDTLTSQITLLVVLGRLCDLYRKEAELTN